MAPLSRSIRSAAALVALFAASSNGQACQKTTASSSPPGSGIALQSYSYCGGALSVTAYVENVDYDKLVNLYYTNGAGQVTSRTQLQLNYFSSIGGTNFEYWGATADDTYLDGISTFVNLTFKATDINKVYMQTLSTKVQPSGAAPPNKRGAPVPYASPAALGSDIDTYLGAVSTSQAAFSKNLLFKNINVNGSANGTVIAAQSYSSPNYAYNWVRDASLTMDVVATLYGGATAAAAQTYYSTILFAYAGARKQQQNDPNLQTSLGEPKFNLDNSVFTGPWGRPQNDGPATSATTLINFATSYMKNGGSSSQVMSDIWNGPVKTDLLYVAAHWQDQSFDIWEEEESSHFYNHLVSYRAMSLCAAFATKMGDSATSSNCSATAAAIAPTLSSFWDSGRGLILYENQGVLHNKSSYEDTATILGILHGYNGDGVYSYSNEEVLSSAYEISTSFLQYPVANMHNDSSGLTLGIPIGRYPEDIYNGTGTADQGGNPWYLCTAAMAELFYRAANEIQTSGNLTISSTSQAFWAYYAPTGNFTTGSYAKGSAQVTAAVGALSGWGDAFMRTIKYHAGATGHLPEEFNRNTGFSQGAADLTWSYAGLLTAAFARAELNGDANYTSSLANLGF